MDPLVGPMSWGTRTLPVGKCGLPSSCIIQLGPRMTNVEPGLCNSLRQKAVSDLGLLGRRRANSPNPNGYAIAA